MSVVERDSKFNEISLILLLTS